MVYVVNEDDGAEVRAVVDPPAGGRLPEQVLGEVSNYSVSSDASWAGGAVVAYHGESSGEIMTTTLAPGEGRFSDPVSLEAVRRSSWVPPLVSVGDRGDAAIAFVASHYDFDAERRVDQGMISVRPPGGAFGRPETFGPELDGLSITDIDVGPDGTVALGLRADEEAKLAIREPGGGQIAPIALGQTGPEVRPQVGVDGSGNVVAGASPGEGMMTAGPFEVTFVPAGGSPSAPMPSGINSTGWSHPGLEVSASGEIVIVGDTAVRHPDGGGQMTGIRAVFGNSEKRTLGAPALIDPSFGSTPSLVMNARGDAVVLWSKCCPASIAGYRRARGGSFGRLFEVAQRPPLNPNSFSSLQLSGLLVDPYGNATLAWADPQAYPYEYFLSADGPRLASAPADGTLPADLPPVLTYPIADPFVPPTPWPDTPQPQQPPRRSDDGRPPELTFWLVPKMRPAGLQFRARCDEQCSVDLRLKVKGLPEFQRLHHRWPASRRARLNFHLVEDPGHRLVEAGRRGAPFVIQGRVHDRWGNADKFEGRSVLIPRNEPGKGD